MSDWKSQKAKAEARDLFAQGVTGAVLAKKYGTTRSAILGHMHLKGIKSPNRPRVKKNVRGRSRKPVRQAVRPRPVFRKPRLDGPPPDIVNDGLGVGLLDLGAADCRFPISGHGAATRFCGSPARPTVLAGGCRGGVYCQAHSRVATGPKRRPFRSERDVPKLRFSGGNW